MKLQHACDIRAPIQTVWDLTSRIDAIAPCLPGASAVKVDDDNFDVTMKLRLGPLDLLFKGKVAVAERNVDKRLMVLKSRANESRGQGSANATTTIQLTDAGASTHASIDTDLLISGRVAQMGRGIVAEVSDDLLVKFVANLEKHLESSSPQVGPKAGAPSAEAAQAGAPMQGSERSLNVFALLARVAWRRFLRLFGLRGDAR